MCVFSVAVAIWRNKAMPNKHQKELLLHTVSTVWLWYTIKDVYLYSIETMITHEENIQQQQQRHTSCCIIKHNHKSQSV